MRKRPFFKTASWIVLVVGLAASLFEALEPLISTDWTDLADSFRAYVPWATVLFVGSVVASAGLQALISIDERLERLLNQSGGK